MSGSGGCPGWLEAGDLKGVSAKPELALTLAVVYCGGQNRFGSLTNSKSAAASPAHGKHLNANISLRHTLHPRPTKSHKMAGRKWINTPPKVGWIGRNEAVQKLSQGFFFH